MGTLGGDVSSPTPGNERYSGGPGGFADAPQDPIVQRRRPTPTADVEPEFHLTGFVGDSDREGWRRLYLTEDLDYYAEFKVEDAVEVESLRAGSGPFRDENCTRVTLQRGSEIIYTRSRSMKADIFDFDPQFDKYRVPDMLKELAGSLGHGTCICTAWTFCHQHGCAY
jgi:hypothetical protein